MNTDIYVLIEKYFDGFTSQEEEESIRRFFAGENIADDLKELAPLFLFLQDESDALNALREIREQEAQFSQKKTLRKILWAAGGIAASLLLAGGIFFHHQIESVSQAGSYAWINGTRITDLDVVQKYAEMSLKNVEPDNNTLEKQLNYIFE